MWRIILVLGVLAAAAAPAAAQQADSESETPAAADQPAPQPAAEAPAEQDEPAGEASAPPGEGGGMQATVVSVSGKAQKLLPAPGSEWQDLTAGEQLDDQTIIRTGLGSKVVLKLADRGEVTLDRATKMGIGELSKRGNAATARLGLKYGRVRAKVETTAGPTDMQIKTASATLSVRGSGANVAQMGLQTRASSFQGSWGLLSPSGFAVLSAGQSGNNTMTPWQNINTQGTQSGLLGPLHGLANTEQLLLLFNGSGRSLPGLIGPFGLPAGLFNLDGRSQELQDWYESHYGGEYGNGFEQ